MNFKILRRRKILKFLSLIHIHIIRPISLNFINKMIFYEDIFIPKFKEPKNDDKSFIK